MAKKKLSDALDSILGEMFAEGSEFQSEAITTSSDSIRTKNERIKNIRPKNIRIKSGPTQQTPPMPVSLDDRYYRMDNEVDDLLMPTLTPLEQCVYRFLYRLSYGWGKSICQVGYEEIQKKVGIESRSTAQKIVQSLISKGCISVFMEKTPRSPRVYRVYLPCEMEQFREQSIRSKNIRIESERIDSIRSENDPLNVQNLDVSSTKNKRINFERIESLPQSSRENVVDITPKTPSKYNIKDIYKNNNKERLLLFFSNTPFEPITPEALDWLSQYDYDVVTQYAQEVLAWPGTKNPMALLRAALINSYKFPRSGRDLAQDNEIKAIIEQQAKQAEAEEQAFKEFKNGLSDEEREKIVTRARESLQNDPFYRVIQSEEIRAKYLDGKIEAEVRKEFEGRKAGIDSVPSRLAAPR